MPDRDSLLRALDLSLQAGGYAQLGPLGQQLLEDTRRDVAAATAGWTEPARAALLESSASLHAAHHELDRARNHFIKHFRARHGADTKAWTPALKSEFDGGIENFTRQKRDLVERAADTLLVRFNLWEKSA